MTEATVPQESVEIIGEEKRKPWCDKKSRWTSRHVQATGYVWINNFLAKCEILDAIVSRKLLQNSDDKQKCTRNYLFYIEINRSYMQLNL